MDFRSLMRAILVNIRQGGLRQGGSTLSQQLAKNLFLTMDRTVKRKVQELLLAFGWSKNLARIKFLPFI